LIDTAPWKGLRTVAENHSSLTQRSISGPTILCFKPVYFIHPKQVPPSWTYVVAREFYLPEKTGHPILRLAGVTLVRFIASIEDFSTNIHPRNPIRNISFSRLFICNT